jgi:DNA-binding MarR family transcriptional regulator/N-acetylglutamate synthase-like GNAT family acetyltransferase
MSKLLEHVATVRAFNRFYTRRIGLLNGAILASEFSLPEMRVLWEISHKDWITAKEIEQRLGMDRGYVSRIINAFQEGGLVTSEANAHDGRVKNLKLTRKGLHRMLAFEKRSSAEIHGIIGKLPGGGQDRLVAAMRTIESLLEPPESTVESLLASRGAAAGSRAPHEGASPIVLREPRPGDFGWVVHRHGALYAQEYGWDATFEAMVAEIVAKFVRNYQPARERCWIAEHAGDIAGCVFLVERSAHVAQLRLLLVEPSKRGMGIGKTLVGECIRFARAAGYRKVMLWTHDILHSALRIYERAGFKRVAKEKHYSFGRDLVGQTWEKKVSGTVSRGETPSARNCP